MILFDELNGALSGCLNKMNKSMLIILHEALHGIQIDALFPLNEIWLNDHTRIINRFE